MTQKTMRFYARHVRIKSIGLVIGVDIQLRAHATKTVKTTTGHTAIAIKTAILRAIKQKRHTAT